MLISLPGVKKYPAGVWAIDAEFMHPGVAAIHAVVHEGEVALIDCGSAHSAPAVLAWLDAMGLAPQAVRSIFLTHVHLDHASGAGLLMQHLPNAKLVVHPRGARHMIDPSRLIQATVAVYGEESVKTLYGTIVPVDPARVVEAADGHEEWLGTRRFLFLDTPGHARHHNAIVDETGNAIFSGDCFGLSYRQLDTQKGPFIFPTTSPSQFDPGAARDTVARLASLGMDSIYLAHFSRVQGVKKLATDLIECLEAFVTLAKQAGAEKTDNRHPHLAQLLTDWLMQRIRKHGVTLPDSTIQEVIAMDVELNAQGLLIWLDQQQSV